MQTIGEIIKGKDYDYVSYRGSIDGSLFTVVASRLLMVRSSH